MLIKMSSYKLYKKYSVPLLFREISFYASVVSFSNVSCKNIDFLNSLSRENGRFLCQRSEHKEKQKF